MSREKIKKTFDDKLSKIEDKYTEKLDAVAEKFVSDVVMYGVVQPATITEAKQIASNFIDEVVK